MLATAPQERDGQLGFYSNGWLTVVAPSGWRCSGIVGATGALFMTVVSPQARLTHGLPSSRTQAVNVYVASPGTGEVGIACALFPNVRPKPNPCTPMPAREKAVRLGPHVVAFEDPPHVKGTGDPSGGLSPANGVMIYDGSKYPQWAAEETCTLPESQHRACTVILNDFVRRYHVEPMRFYSRGA